MLSLTVNDDVEQVEGDELATLQGIDDADWPRIAQIVLEVHDYPEDSSSDGALVRDGDVKAGAVLSRLDAVLSLLAKHGYCTSVRAAGSSLAPGTHVGRLIYM